MGMAKQRYSGLEMTSGRSTSMQINDDEASYTVDSICWCSSFFVQCSMACRSINKCSAYEMNEVKR